MNADQRKQLINEVQTILYCVENLDPKPSPLQLARQLVKHFEAWLVAQPPFDADA